MQDNPDSHIPSEESASRKTGSLTTPNTADNQDEMKPENLTISIWQERGNYRARPGDLEND